MVTGWGIRRVGVCSGLGLLFLVLLVECGLGEGFSGRVVGVSDGDTISVMNSGKAVKVRLHGVDAPERGQPFTNRAKQFVSGLVFGQTVIVRGRGVDRYGRTIADVLLPDGRNLNHEAVKAGLAWWFRRYAPNDKNLGQLENEARTAKRGLWTEKDPVPPARTTTSRPTPPIPTRKAN